MRSAIWPLLALAALVVVITAGCSRQQQAYANNQGQRAKQQLSQAASQAGKELSDDTITLKVKAALGASDQVNTSRLHVKTRARVVYLQGAVPNAHQKALALQIARDTVGPGTQVVNQLGTSGQAVR